MLETFGLFVAKRIASEYTPALSASSVGARSTNLDCMTAERSLLSSEVAMLYRILASQEVMMFFMMLANLTFRQRK